MFLWRISVNINHSQSNVSEKCKLCYFDKRISASFSYYCQFCHVVLIDQWMCCLIYGIFAIHYLLENSQNRLKSESKNDERLTLTSIRPEIIKTES
jgi:hypothetical protein